MLCQHFCLLSDTDLCMALICILKLPLYFVVTYLLDRASIEPNFHDLYLKFLDKVNSKALNKEIVQATYENCRVCI